MKYLALAGLLALNACVNDSNDAQQLGSVNLEFDHKVGSEDLVLSKKDDNYNYTKADGQAFSVSKFGYYITNIELVNSDASVWQDEVNSSAVASEVKGFYQITSEDESSQLIQLSGVDDGVYSHVRITIGIPEETVSQGAQGGILDLAEGAWFWNWNSGYIGMVLEGYAEDSQQEADDSHEAKSFQYHIGGWRDVEPEEGMMKMFVNNVRTVEMELPKVISVSQGVTPKVHLIVDVLKLLEGAEVDFAENSHVHMPAQGAAVANQFDKAFIVHHVH